MIKWVAQLLGYREIWVEYAGYPWRFHGYFWGFFPRRYPGYTTFFLDGVKYYGLPDSTVEGTELRWYDADGMR